MKFNLNDEVTVTLTDEGRRMLREEYSFDVSGDTYSCELWRLMYDFGKYMYMGNPFIPFSMEVELEERSNR